MSLLAYFVGSVCTGILVCKSLKVADPRSLGSKNPGVTNVLRIAGKKAAAMTLAGDVLKGSLPILLGHLLQMKGFGLSVVGLAALLGHVFPFFFEFKGGKGVATGLGIILALSPITGVISAVVWLLITVLTRYVSLASLSAASIAPLLILWQLGLPAFVPIFIMSALLFWRHKDNIDRLQAGNEPKFDLQRSL